MTLLFMCIKIFFARILDVSMGTVRTMMTVKGKTITATVIGFIEVTIWFLIVKDALNSESNSFWIVVSYAGGFACGTYIGGMLSKRFIKSNLGIQIIIKREHSELIDVLRNAGYAVSVIDVEGYNSENKCMLFLEIPSERLLKLEALVNSYDEKVFMTISETKYVRNGYFGEIVK